MTFFGIIFYSNKVFNNHVDKPVDKMLKTYKEACLRFRLQFRNFENLSNMDLFLN